MAKSFMVATAMAAVALIFCGGRQVDAYNILFCTLYGSLSHMETFKPAIEALHARGHNVSYLTTLPVASQFPQINFHFMETSHRFMLSQKVDRFDVNAKLSDAFSRLSEVANLEACPVLLSDPGFLKLANDRSTKYDVVIIDPVYAECGLSLLHLIGNPPFIYYCTTHLYSHIAYSLGIPTPTPYFPVTPMHMPNLTTVLGRASNAFYFYKINVLRSSLLVPLVEYIVNGVYPTVPPLLDIERNVSFVFANSHSLSFDISRPLTPYVAEVGGTHCRPPKPLSKDLEDFINEAGPHGFIYISFGTFVNDTVMHPDKANAFIRAFGRLKQRVIWKQTGSYFTDLPPNVRTFSWLPQQDLLGHPKIKVFISQGGQLSVQEAIYHCVPVLGMPFIGDQFVNTRNIEEKGLGLELYYKKLDEQTLYDSLMQLIHNPRYKETCERYSKLIRDRSKSAIDTIIYWVEYVARYKGAENLRVNYYQRPEFMFQYLLFDVIGVTIAFFVIAYIVLVFIVNRVIRVLRAILITWPTASYTKIKKLL